MARKYRKRTARSRKGRRFRKRRRFTRKRFNGRRQRRVFRRKLINTINDATIAKDPVIRVSHGELGSGTVADYVAFCIGGISPTNKEGLTFGPIEILATDTALGVGLNSRYTIIRPRSILTLMNSSNTIQTCRATWWKITKNMPSNGASTATLAQWVKSGWANHSGYPAANDVDPTLFMPVGTSIYDSQKFTSQVKMYKKKTCKVLPGTSCTFKITAWKRYYRDTQVPITVWAGIRGQKFMMLEFWSQPYRDTTILQVKSGYWRWTYRLVRRHAVQANLTPNTIDYTVTMPTPAAFTNAENTINPATDSKTPYADLS